MDYNRIFGILCVIGGLTLSLWALGLFLLRLCGAVLGLFVVNYGLRLMGMPALHIILMRLWSSRYDF